MEGAHVETNAEEILLGRDFFEAFFDTNSKTHKEWQAHTEVVADPNLLRDHDFHEPAMTVLPITKILICSKILFGKLRLFPSG